jgi:hypothetical protein
VREINRMTWRKNTRREGKKIKLLIFDNIFMRKRWKVSGAK